MTGYILRRCLAGIVILFVASFLMFVLVAESGDPLATLRANPHVTPATIEAARHQLGPGPAAARALLDLADGILHGDFGKSTTGRRWAGSSGSGSSSRSGW